MKAAAILSVVIGFSAVTAAAATPPYCSQPPIAGKAASPVCADAALRAIETELAQAFEAARARLAVRPAFVAALEQDETRFLDQRDAIIANLAKVDPYNRKEKAEFHDPARIMRRRIAFLKRIDPVPRKTKQGEWGSAEGMLAVHPRDHGAYVSLEARRKKIGLDKVEDWLCWGMGDFRGRMKPEPAELPATIYRGDGENLQPQAIVIRLVNGMAEVAFRPAGKRKSGHSAPVCEGNAASGAPISLFPLRDAR